MDQLAELAIGQRDSILFGLYETTFGPEVAGLATCPNCGEHLETNFNVADVRVEANDTNGVLFLNCEGYEVRIRLPNSFDLISISGIKDLEAGKDALLKRCLIEIRDGSGEVSFDQIPSEIEEAIAESMEDADPQGNVKVNLSCPSCECQWQVVFDILSFIWDEINAWSQRTLRDVHVLAKAYGWSERDILEMTSYRRQIYLEMTGS